MTDHPDDLQGEPKPGLKAARARLGLSQDETADLVGAARGTYKTWDRGERRPRDPEMVQALSQALETPIEILWPPQNNPVVGPKFIALREQRAREEAAARDAQAHENAEADLADPSTDPDQIWAEPVAEPVPRSVPDWRAQVRTLDGEDNVHAGVARSTRGRRFLVPAAASVAVIVAAGTAIATAGDNTPTPAPTPTVQAGPSAAQRERAAQRAALELAQQRGDYDQAITIAARLDDVGTGTQLRTTAGGVLARRAATAAERGDLALATARLDKAERRYGDLPAVDVVRRRINAIKAARVKRAAERKRAARKRAVARARAAAAAQRRAQTQAVTPPRSSATPSTPSSPSTPAPSTPRQTPAPSSGGSSGGSGGGSKPNGGSSSNSGVDPGLY